MTFNCSKAAYVFQEQKVTFDPKGHQMSRIENYVTHIRGKGDGNSTILFHKGLRLEKI